MPARWATRLTFLAALVAGAAQLALGAPDGSATPMPSTLTQDARP